MKHSIYLLRSTVLCCTVDSCKAWINRCCGSAGLSYDNISFHKLVPFLPWIAVDITILVYFNIIVHKNSYFLCTFTVATTSMPVPATFCATISPICTGALTVISFNACMQSMIRSLGISRSVLTDTLGSSPPSTSSVVVTAVSYTHLDVYKRQVWCMYNW